MADVFDNISFIRTAHYGREVRTAIADSIEQCYADATAGSNSLASIIKGLTNGGIGDTVWGENDYVDDVTVNTNTMTIINSLSVPIGTWLILYNASFMPDLEEDASGRALSVHIRTTLNGNEASIANSYSYCSIEGNVHLTMNGHVVITVESDDSSLIDGEKVFNLAMTHYANNGAVANSVFYAIRLKNELDGASADTSLTEQVAENTAAIANLQTLDTDISSIRSQHENDIDELTDLIEDSVVSLRASLDEKTLSLDENDYLTLD